MDETSTRRRITGRILKTINFTREIARQVDDARVERGQSFTTFVQNAVIKALDAFEAEADQKRSKREAGRESKRSAPAGLGIRERLQESATPVYEESEERPAAAPVVVNVNSAAATTAPSGDLATLARMVVEGAPADRRRLLESACKALAKNAHTQEERISLAEQLDAEIKRLDVPMTALERVRARRKR